MNFSRKFNLSASFKGAVPLLRKALGEKGVGHGVTLCDRGRVYCIVAGYIICII